MWKSIILEIFTATPLDAHIHKKTPLAWKEFLLWNNSFRFMHQMSLLTKVPKFNIIIQIGIVLLLLAQYAN